MENIRVRSLNSIRTMGLFLTILIGFIAMFSEERNITRLNLWITKSATRIYNIPEFDYYAIADGIYNIFKKAKTGIQNFINDNIKLRQSQQLTLAKSLL